MIKKFIGKLIDKATGNGNGRKRFGKRAEIGPDGHGINPALVDERAANVVRTLKEAGYEAYIVGGAVRDLLLGLKPKDFDVATNATPEQVKALFRRAFIIGRRFRIVHVVYGRGREHEVIEVSTFRAYMDNATADAMVQGNERTAKGQLAGMKHAVDASGRVLRDNVWGSQEEDAARRDFSVNAMYYDPESRVVVDYHHGLQDAQKKLLRMIGDAATRYREDPVRIIRAVRFGAKLSTLGFRLEPKTARPLAEARSLLAEIPQSRLFDEMIKLLQTGHAVASVDQLRALGLSQGIYPLLDLVVERANQPFVKAALLDTDRRVSEGKPVAPSFLLASVLWQDVLGGWNARLARGEHPFPALQDAIDEVFNARVGDVSGRGKLGADMREIWMMQPRFEKRSGNTPFSLAEQPRFRAGFDFLRLRADVGEIDEELADWWQAFSVADGGERESLVRELRAEQQRAKKAPRVHRVLKPAAAPDGQAPEAIENRADDVRDDAGEGAPTPAKKRRRRRRKPAGGNGAPAAPAPGEPG
ncbi:polynucleotide adenylyltransferase PcnB [Ottowia sp.]|uniref:polynucleotide adenylyltransferase PcnB n=1 Tax=Ottowia sp. TaxID=1898956 RepID=UPI002C8C3489|nr:polynucleotide adenylyltransferase PcnB [Ottowia sp.]HOB66591.1 polynucleotide adenylyltransferase PcnB [Ottowia sp.]HPZ57744.1 polynucleotide adenylyltransferase PcnB [Ottowia sp.]HQD48565.1 polynucleotide adenylyltransferase PcnB [Ottowia sp.]